LNRHLFEADPDPTFHFYADPDPDPADPIPGLTQIEQSEITHGKQLRNLAI
jgi:hypothetical protein